MKTKLSLLIFLLAFSVTSTFAHALWIETSSTGKKGQPQIVKVFFGEYETNKPDSAAKWFSNLKDFSLVLTAPNGTQTTLNATADSLFYKTSFTPTQDGTYILSVVHTVKDLYQNAKLQYYAFANVTVGTDAKINTAFPETATLTIRPSALVLKTDQFASHQLVFNAQPKAKERVSIVSPDFKKLEVETASDGTFTFSPKQKGAYFLEAFAEDKTSGSFYGKAYEKVWHVVTYYTTIN